ncbi:hypothetical protein MHA_1056 [Mannheimia haemolytica PHL213]|nr:hypothetical protein MHA_1056 [Mannheimia haemolytica PHL213]
MGFGENFTHQLFSVELGANNNLPLYQIMDFPLPHQ